MSTPETAPAPPTEFSEYYSPHRLVRVATVQDALGGALLYDQADLLEEAVKQSDAAFSADYWQDLREFYGIEQNDADFLPLGELARKYQFADVHAAHAQSHAYSTLSSKHEHASWKASNGTEFQTQDLDREIQTLRDYLKVVLLDPYAQAVLDQYLATEMPVIFNTMRESSGAAGMPWHEWITTGADTEQFMNFLQWHNYHMKEVNEDPDIQERIDYQKEGYTAALHALVAQSALPIHSQRLKELTHKIEGTQVFIGDVFSTLAQGIVGYYLHRPNYNWQYIVVEAESIEHATKHELNHAILGSFVEKWLDEAATEHLSIVMSGARLLPVGALTGRGTYRAERKLLATLLTQGAEIIPTTTLLKGYIETKHQGVTDSFERAVDHAWGRGALGRVNAALHALKTEYMARGLSQIDATSEAAIRVRMQLLTKPQLVFGNDYIKAK